MLSLSGCIVADPPQYQEPRRTPAILDLSNALPSPFWLVIVDRKDNLEPDKVVFYVPFHSDDQGERVFFNLHVDYKGRDIPLAPQNPLPPATIDVDKRAISTEWTVDGSIPAGCHQITLLVAHESSWEYNTQQPKPEAPKEDIAIATWWMNLDPERADPYTLPGCPSQSEVEQ
jgi:hypothetical protein